MENICIDLRLINASGIGTYLRNIVPLIINNFTDIKFTLLGKEKNLFQLIGSYNSNIEIINYDAPIYSIAEQLRIIPKIPKNTVLFWSPHYNIPLFNSGKLLVNIHDICHVALPQFVKDFYKRLYVKKMFNWIKKKADIIICDSHFTANEVKLLLNIPPEKVRVIHLGVSETWFNVKMEKRLHSKPYILYVGNVKPHKNLSRLLDAFTILLNKIPHDLIVVGKKEGFITGDKNVFHKANKLNGRVYFTDYVDDYTLTQFYIFADLLVLPSLYEGFGLPPLEAMACGCPVVVSNVASLPEICAEAAYYVDPYSVKDIADGIYRVLTDDIIRRNLILRGLKRATLFSWEKSAREHIKVIKEGLNG